MSKRVAIFTDDPGWHGKRLREAFARHGYVSDYVSLTECHLVIETGHLPVAIPGFEDDLPAAAFVRGVPGGSLQEVVFYLDILHALQALGVPVYNGAAAIERSVDKGMTSFLLRQAGLPTPPTWVLRDAERARALAERELLAGHTLLCKPLFGSQGEGIRRIATQADLEQLQADNGIFYLQRFVECAGNGYSDYRVFVVNGQALAAMRRCGVTWLNNVAQGAHCEPLPLHDEVAMLAVAATQALHMDYAGVDIIASKDGGHTVIEVNSIPAWKGLQGVCQVDIAARLVDDLLSRHLPQITLPTLQAAYA